MIESHTIGIRKYVERSEEIAVFLVHYVMQMIAVSIFRSSRIWKSESIFIEPTINHNYLVAALVLLSRNLFQLSFSSHFRARLDLDEIN